MEISDELLCLFTAHVDEENGSYIIEVPQREVASGTLQPGETYRVGVLLAAIAAERPQEANRAQDRSRGPPEPPVDEGEHREVEIEDIGEQGDGIARVERGYVIIVPETEQGERVTIEITEVRENVAFGEVVERQTHF